MKIDIRVDDEGYGKIKLGDTWRAVVPFFVLEHEKLLRVNQGSGDLGKFPEDFRPFIEPEQDDQVTIMTSTDAKGLYISDVSDPLQSTECAACAHDISSHRRMKSNGAVFCLGTIGTCNCNGFLYKKEGE